MRKVFIIFVLLAICTSTIVFSYSGKIVQEIPAPYKRSTGLTYDGNNLWVADYQKHLLICIDPKTGETVKEIPSPGLWPLGLAWDGTNLWNIDKYQRRIFKIDPDNGTILSAIGTPSGSSEGLTWVGNTLWVTDSRSDEIMKIDLSDGTAVKTFSAPDSDIRGITYDGTYFWCTDRMKDEIYMVDPDNGEVIIITDSPGPFTRGIAWDGQYLWNVDYQTNTIYQLVSRDDELYTLKDKRKARITVTHTARIFGNGNLHNLDVYFALPEESPAQKILSKSFNPESYDVVKDRWNQPFALFQYKNKTSETALHSIMTVEAEINVISYFIYPDNCGTLKDIPKKIKEDYTADGSKYQINDPYMQDLVKKVVGDEKNPYWIARKVFDHVRKTLEYKLEGGWNTAPVVLKRGTGSCSEYSFCFIALCRAAGLPARYVGSIVVRGDDASLDGVFHRWPQVYLPNYGWIHMDPQGGDEEKPRDRAMSIGHLSNRFLITTQGGGDSEYMGWYYNTDEKYITDPQVRVEIDSYGEWEPLEGGK